MGVSVRRNGGKQQAALETGAWAETVRLQPQREDEILVHFFPRGFRFVVAGLGNGYGMGIASRLRNYTGLPQATKAISYVLGQYSRVGVGVFLCPLVRREWC